MPLTPSCLSACLQPGKFLLLPHLVHVMHVRMCVHMHVCAAAEGAGSEQEELPDGPPSHRSQGMADPSFNPVSMHACISTCGRALMAGTVGARMPRSCYAHGQEEHECGVKMATGAV